MHVICMDVHRRDKCVCTAKQPMNVARGDIKGAVLVYDF